MCRTLVLAPRRQVRYQYAAQRGSGRKDVEPPPRTDLRNTKNPQRHAMPSASLTIERMPNRSILVQIGLQCAHSTANPMAINVKLPETLVEIAKRYGKIEHRSLPKQIEYWSKIGKIAAENPDLPFSVIRDILIADQQEPVGEYKFG